MNHTVHFRHSNINNYIDKTLFGSSFFFFFFQHRSGTQCKHGDIILHGLKSLGKKCQTLRNLEKGLANNNVVQRYGVLRNNISTWVKDKSQDNHRIKNKEKKQWLQTSWPSMIELLQRFESLHMYDALENNLALSLNLTENKIPITVKISLYFLSVFLFRLTKVYWQK